MSMIFIATGNAMLGRTTMDKDGNILEKIPPHFDVSPEGACVAVGELDPETMVVKGNADVFGNWDAAGYMKKALEMLKPGRKVNIPDLAAITRALHKDGVDVCEYCRTYNCANCILDQWKEEEEE